MIMKRLPIMMLMMCVATLSQALENIKVGNTTRTMISYAPKGLPASPALMIACHGANQDAPYLQSLAKWESVADTAKFVVVYANGVNKYWDISGTSDLQFMEVIIDSMYSRYHINKNRVYLTGFSMGGMFTYHAANRMADKIAAFAPVSGYPMGGPNASASRPVPILHTHGTADDVCSYGPVQSHIDAWVKFNGCNPTPEIIKPYPKSKPNSPAELKRYRGGKNGVEVALLTLADKGHWWSMDTAQALTSEEIWNFCKRYSLGPDGPELTGITPENRSFDMLADRDNTFSATFSEPVSQKAISATLTSEKGTAIALETQQSEDYSPTVTFKIPSGSTVADGIYTLSIMNATNKEGGVAEPYTFTYVYGVEEVGATLNVDTIFCPDLGAERDAIGEGIPAGWRRVMTPSSGSAETLNGAVANCAGVRMKYFQPGGDFDAGFYLSAREYASCNLYYSYAASKRLPFKKGKYRVSFNSTYWSEGAKNANATFNFYLKDYKEGKTAVSATSLLSSNTMKESTDQQITGSKYHEIDFNITTTTFYVLDFEMSEGWNSVILGNILVITQPSIADIYKGGFFRTMLAAKESVKGYEQTDEGMALLGVIASYDDFASIEPSKNEAATKAVADALAKFNAVKGELTPPLSVPGDVNGDGTVDISDIVAIINQIAGTASYENADVNSDKTVDISDIVAVINIIAEGSTD
ncbi:MAG: hypothetical protein IJ607_10345 [Bacteroidaceae bacterium]|nr:hypothetical protein [Bacteroidaceae bacterium]